MPNKINNANNVIQVAIPTPLRKIFDYLPPAHDQTELKAGMRVIVPFGRQKQTMGIVINITNHSNVPKEQLKHITNIIDSAPLLPKSMHDLLCWASNYYKYPLGMVFDAAFTSSLMKGKTANQYQLEKSKQNINFSNNKNSIKLNNNQKTAISAIAKSFNNFQTFLLDGVTGSGKTEIYLQIISKALTENKQALILIPEISLTPQTLSQFKQRFSDQISVFHSQIGEKEKTTTWFKALLGITPIIIGTRSAAFIPLKNPGIFVIDEEHDLSFKQQEGFKYSARDLLIKRAQIENCPIVLGSATPSLESIWNANKKRYVHLKLPERVGTAINPHIEILDIQHKKLNKGLSLQLLSQIEKHLNKKEQVLLFLNRRGYAPVLMCSNCNWFQICKHCDARMILHFHPKPSLICHHCQTNLKLPSVCPKCNNIKLIPLGLGTEKLELTLKSIFPNANILRVDRDVTRKKNAMNDIVEQILSGHANILIGTQMLAKGHHFPQLSLVAIIDIDGALFNSDFRTIERMGQLVTQVSGRAGRAELPGHVVLQTQHPNHPLLHKLLTQGYSSLCKTLLEERSISKLPPFGHQILFQSSSKQSRSALDFLLWIKNQSNKVKIKDIEILGPIPAPIEKKAGSFRAQLLIQSQKRNLIQQLTDELINKIEKYPKRRQVRWSIDVDPLDFY